MIFVSKTFDELSTDELYEILKARFQIFTLEQGFMRQDTDDLDRKCLHCFYTFSPPKFTIVQNRIITILYFLQAD